MGNYLSTLYAQIWPQVKGNENMTIGLTEVQNESFEFYWIIKNFSQLEQSSVKSPEFAGGKEKKWVLILYPKKKVDDQYWTGIYLQLINPGCKKVWTNFKIFFTLNGLTFENFSSHEFTKDHDNWGWNCFLNYPEKVENDQITIVCKVSSKNLVANSQLIDNKFYNSLKHNGKNEKFRSDFGKLLNNPAGVQWDLKILVDGRDFKAHKAILSARSPVFSRMLSTGMKEAQSSTIRIDDFDPEIVQNMLEFIYTGKTDLGQNVLELFHISDKYDLPDLKDLCEMELVKNLNFENALALFDIGDKFNAPMLKSVSIEFIIRNDEEIVKHPGFKENLKNNSQLSFEIMKAVLLDKKGQKPKINIKILTFD